MPLMPLRTYYRIEAKDSASEGSMISFGRPAGIYDIVVAYYDETDGT
ncbi:hypothetical protein [Trichocoleus sp. FACHB-262]|nr:hypothetical protein [Trichocoleus sp. FACHB-262]MBD2119884.1 hypothetical protein [Trichocoleus sp. FACHB-262]